MAGRQKVQSACLNLFSGLRPCERRPVFSVRDLAPPASRWSGPASESAGAPWSLRLAAPHHPSPSYCILSFMQTQHPPPLFSLPSSFSSSFHLLQPPPPPLSPFAPMSLALSPTFPPSLCGLLRRHRCRRFISEAQPLTLQAGGAPPLHLSASPPVLLALQAPVLRHGDIRHSAFVKVKVLRVGERLENHRRQSSLTHVPQIFNEAAGV